MYDRVGGAHILVAKKTKLLFSGAPDELRADDGTTLDRGAPTKLMLRRRELARRCGTCDRVFSGDEVLCPFDGAALLAEPGYTASDDPLIGVTLDERYRVEEVIAEGGMGTVYRVRHTKLGSAFAMKVLRRDLADDPNIADRLIEEARATAAIGHPNIVAAADFGEIDSTVLPELGKLKLPFFVMEHLSGYTLAELIDEVGSLSPPRIANIVSQVASALTAAHRAGIVHRDLKPDNIRLVRDDEGNELAKVVDFGVAKVIGASKKTQQGIVFGTPHYMSPEQGRGDAIDQRTDIYALGVIIYECLTGEVPFIGDTFVGIITQHLQTPPPELARGLRKTRLATVMHRCLQKEPKERYATMAEIVTELAEGVAVPRIPGESPSSPWMWAVAVGCVVVTIGVALRYLPTPPAPPVRDDGSASTPAAVTAPPVTGLTSASASASSPKPPPTAPLGTTAPISPTQSPPPPQGTSPVEPKPAGDVVDPWG